ncbi:hypothetical protein PD5205_02754 [Xanthomonas fragariae]|uniref:Uncharacterized protein n=1 Tax=Xanthomonas fragariae TaxID=48664 RepID=A0A1Y6HKL2_9XANT|nr:hypothetical protein NBC2815_02752 [Xanthomonas fragariae]SMQ98492.1 hypothetical protein PD885_01241 [Xanthomonas fragariae]SMR04044.1 hypothetical protein PD5205_02754 [Xanthomonas fragariae]
MDAPGACPNRDRRNRSFQKPSPQWCKRAHRNKTLYNQGFTPPRNGTIDRRQATRRPLG